MALYAIATPSFLRQTAPAPHQYQKNFCQIDHDILDLVTSPAADRVTPLMSKIYLRLRRAPSDYWERPGVLHLRGAERAGQRISAWQRLCELAGVASATAAKALGWLHEQAIIGYAAHKNGVGIRIFFNRAANSIGRRPVVPPPTSPPPAPAAPAPSAGARPGQKILPSRPTAPAAAGASTTEVPFKDVRLEKSLDSDLDPPAAAPAPAATLTPDGGTTATRESSLAAPSVAANLVAFPPTAPTAPSWPATDHQHQPATPAHVSPLAAEGPLAAQTLLPWLTQLLTETRRELAARIEQQVQQAVGHATQHEAARTRQWFEERALPKAVRVAQRETYQLLRRHDGLRAQEQAARVALQTGRPAEQGREATPVTAPEPSGAQSEARVTDYAEICAVQWQLHQTPFGETLRCLCAADAPLPPHLTRRVEREAARLVAARHI